MTLMRPRTLERALDLLAADRWCVLAGGTDMYAADVEKPIMNPILDITGLSELAGIRRDADGWWIGALTRWRDVTTATLLPAFDGLRLAAREVGSVQIQNVGTIAGNLCNASPAADGVPPLLTLDASVELTSRKGARVLPLQDFLTGYRATAIREDELLTAVLIPDAATAGASHFLKLGARKYLVISIVMVAVRLVAEHGRVTEARVAVGACSPVALRLRTLEQNLVGAPLDRVASGVSSEHIEALSPIDDVRASVVYRRDAALTLICRAIEQTAGGLR